MSIEKFNLYGIDVPVQDKALRELVGSEPLETEAQTITGAINEIAESGGGGGAPADYLKTASCSERVLDIVSNKNVHTTVEVPEAVTDSHINDLIDAKTDGHSHTNKSFLDTLTGLKTINGQSVIGDGNITIEGGGSGGSWTRQDLTLDSDAASVSFTFDGAKEVFVFINGRVNNADNSLANANASVAVSVNNSNRILYDALMYVRTSDIDIPSVASFECKGGYVTGYCRRCSGKITQNQSSSVQINMGVMSAEQINKVAFSLVANSWLFKSGCVFEVYSR